jgi:hypothetical protein
MKMRKLLLMGYLLLAVVVCDNWVNMRAAWDDYP